MRKAKKNSLNATGKCSQYDLSAVAKSGTADIAQVVATGQAVTLMRQSAVVDGETQIHEVNLAPEPILRYAPDGRRIYVNDEVERMTEIPISVPLGGSSSDGEIVPAHDGVSTGVSIQRICETGEPGKIEVENVGDIGRLRHFHWHLEPEFGADGRVSIVFSIGHDSTGCKRSEIVLQENFDRIAELTSHLERQAQEQELKASREQLQQTEAWYRSILRSAPDGILVIDGHGVIVQTNAQLETLFGYEEKELIGSHVEMLVPAAIRNMHGTKRGKFVASGCLDRTMASTLNLRGCHKDGSEFPVEIRLSQLPDIDGRVGATCAVIRDITERKCMEDALHAREQEFRALVENSPDAVSRYDQDCRRTYLNPAVERMTGVPAATLLGKTPIEGPINEISLGEKQLACIQQVLLTGAPTEIELAWVHADGAPQQFHLHFVPEHDQDGQVTSVLAVGRDISAHKLAEKSLRDSRDIV
ncbi:MAG TPA: PAS domain S-box protein, partial [Rhodoferax sp.]